jgi:hypothetical protein
VSASDENRATERTSSIVNMAGLTFSCSNRIGRRKLGRSATRAQRPMVAV